MASVIILSGVSGSGKSSYIKNYMSDNPNVGVYVVSADHSFLGKDGTYKFDPSKLTKAHAQFFRHYIE